jgi:hypothetical protein
LVSQIRWYPFFSALGPIQGHKLQHLLIALGQIDFILFFYFSLNPSLKPLELISTFAPIGILDLG